MECTADWLRASLTYWFALVEQPRCACGGRMFVDLAVEDVIVTDTLVVRAIGNCPSCPRRVAVKHAVQCEALLTAVDWEPF